MSLELAVVEARENRAVISCCACLSSEVEETALERGPVQLGVVLGLHFRRGSEGSMGCWMRLLECSLSGEVEVPCSAEGPALVVEGQGRLPD